MRKHDWYDLLWHTGDYRHPVRIQFCTKTRKVRAKLNDSETWLCSNDKHTIQTAEGIGYRLLEGKDV